MADSASLLCLGLELVGFKAQHIQWTRYKKNLSHFRSAYGVGPIVVVLPCHILEIYSKSTSIEPWWWWQR